jgi:hypothetical protein
MHSPNISNSVLESLFKKGVKKFHITLLVVIHPCTCKKILIYKNIQPKQSDLNPKELRQAHQRIWETWIFTLISHLGFYNCFFYDQQPPTLLFLLYPYMCSIVTPILPLFQCPSADYSQPHSENFAKFLKRLSAHSSTFLYIPQNQRTESANKETKQKNWEPSYTFDLVIFR